MKTELKTTTFIICEKKNDFSKRFEALGIDAMYVDKGRDLLSEISGSKPQQTVIFLDCHITDMEWLTVLEQMYQYSIKLKTIIIDKSYNVQTAIEAAKAGAHDYWSILHFEDGHIKAKLETVLNEPLNQKNWHDIFLRDVAFDRQEQDALESLVTVRVAAEDPYNFSKTKFLNHVIESTRSKTVGLNDIKEGIESFLNKPLHQLKKPKLLVIEDESAVAEALSTMLEDGFEIIIANTEDQASDILNKTQDFSIITIDQRLGNVLGSGLYAKFKEIIADTPVIFITAEQSSELVVQMIKKGVHDYVIKPFDPDALILIMTRSLCHKRWPFYQGKLNIQDLSYKQRLAFLSYELDRCAQKDEPINLEHILCLFPELLIYYQIY